jgi:hypothetical protein
LDEDTEIIPTVLEIPSKNYPYCIEKDCLMMRAIRRTNGENYSKDILKKKKILYLILKKEKYAIKILFYSILLLL